MSSLPPPETHETLKALAKIMRAHYGRWSELTALAGYIEDDVQREKSFAAMFPKAPDDLEQIAKGLEVYDRASNIRVMTYHTAEQAKEAVIAHNRTALSDANYAKWYRDRIEKMRASYANRDEIFKLRDELDKALGEQPLRERITELADRYAKRDALHCDYCAAWVGAAYALRAVLAETNEAPTGE